jgi:hypothetical protein
MHHADGAEFGELALLGYDAYRLGHAHQPDAPLRPGDIVHASLYWQALTAPGGDWQVELSLIDADAREWGSIVAEPVGAFPTSQWQTGDVWRGQFNLALPADVAPGRYRLSVRPIAPDGTARGPFLSDLLSVE